MAAPPPLHGGGRLPRKPPHPLQPLAATLLALLALLLPCTAKTPPPRPDILLILADDLGFSDLGCYGGEISTPNLDSLADHGLRFTQFYNTSRCWPTRAAILTGYYPQAIRRDALPGMGGGTSGVRPPWARLLPEYLRSLGYRSYHSGKWHIDGPRLPAGFDHSYSIEDHDRNFGPRLHLEDDLTLPPVPAGSDYFTSTAIADHAIRYLREHAGKNSDRPFFHYLCFTSPHFPLQAPAEDIARYRDRYLVGWDVIREERWKRQRRLGLPHPDLPAREASMRPAWNLSEDELRRTIDPAEVARAVAWTELTPEQQRFQATKMAIHAAMVSRMDHEIGRVIAELKTLGRWDNTLVLFLSDNGASAEQIVRGDGHDPAAPPGSARSFICLGPGWSTAANTPFRLHKSWTHEGGVATPLIVHWPAGLGQVPSLRHTVGHVVDLPPTLLELAGGQWPQHRDGIPVPPSHGVSLVPALLRDRQLPHPSLWWYHERHKAVRVGDWKLVSLGDRGNGDPDSWELYDLRHDRSETRDVAKQHPDRVTALANEWERRLHEFQGLAATNRPSR